MSMVSLTIAPLISGNDDFQNWWYGLIPAALFVCVSMVLKHKKILSWDDNLSQIDEGKGFGYGNESSHLVEYADSRVDPQMLGAVEVSLQRGESAAE